ncbi:MAG: FAD-dependent oxidoreductase [Planctomycetota bacterium]|nr:FAD-dependent oxidoreductase [Planctomycetota bacterium]
MTRRDEHEADVCVIGGGMAGLAAALSAARHGATVILMHDRPVLGGNSSSECRMHVSGADRHNKIPNVRETGILEELRLTNVRHNRQRSFSVWDTVLYDAARREENLTLMLNCSCCDAEMDGEKIVSITGWQTTTQIHRTVRAKIFIDASGDAILAPLTGAEFRMGREGRYEYGESFAPEKPDSSTMGMTLCFAAREHDTPQPFEPPDWANRYDRCEDLPEPRERHLWWSMGYWWIELGGMDHSIHDTEKIRDELLAVVYGVWDHIKNRGDHGADNWALEWVQFLPGKRESRRYVGKHVLTQNDIGSEGRFDDVVAYGGWTMDDHTPEGFGCAKLGLPPTIFNPAPSPYGIPYGVLVARDIENLMFAGRCASCSHMAMSSTRVMATATVMGQAAGTASAIAIRRGITPADVSEYIDELQQTLLSDDAYLPGVPQRFSETTMQAELTASSGEPEPLRDGINRPVGDDEHAWRCRVGDTLVMQFPAPCNIKRLTLIADSSLDTLIQMSHFGDFGELTAPPESLIRDARVEVLSAGKWSLAGQVKGNYHRLIRIPIDSQAACDDNGRVEAIRLTIEKTWGAEETRLFAAYVE